MVKRVVAQDLLSGLKAFAFAESPELQDGRQSGLEISKAFYFADPVPTEIAHKISRELCKTTFRFAAFTIPPLRHKRSFAYTVSASVERTLPVLESRHLALLDPATKEAYDDFEEIEEGALCEEISTEFDASDHQLGTLGSSFKYELSYAGDTIFSNQTEDVLYGAEGTFESIDPDESTDHASQHFVEEHISHEALPGADEVIANIGFWAMVGPLSADYEQGVSYESAASQIKAILHSLQTGRLS